MDIWVASTFWLLLSHAAMNTGVQTSLQNPVFNSFGYILRGGIAGSHGNSMFNFLRMCHAVFFTVATPFTFSPTVHNGSNLSMSSLTPIVLFYSIHLNECNVLVC